MNNYLVEENEMLRGMLLKRTREGIRYYEALEEIRKSGTYGTDIITKVVVRSPEACIAVAALEGETE